MPRYCFGDLVEIPSLQKLTDDSDVTAKVLQQEEREQSRRRVEPIIGSAMDGFWIADTEGRLLQVNDAYCRMSGYTKTELLGKRIVDLEAIESPDEASARIQGIIADGGGRFETTQVAKDGSRFDVEMSIQYQPWDQGRCVGFIREITERKRAEELLRESEEKFSKAFLCAPLMFAITDLETGRYLDANEEVSRVSGFSREEIIGHTAVEIGWNTPENRARMVAELAARGRIGGLELTLHARDGRPISCIVSGERVTIAGKECLLTTTMDLTELKKTGEALRRYEMLAEHSRDIILFIDRESGRLLEANAAAVEAYGYSRDELLNLTIRELRDPETRALTTSQMAEALDHGTMFETIHRRKDGTAFPVEVSSKGLIAENVPTLVSVIRDISERKKAEAEKEQLQERLAHSQKMEAIGTLAGGIAHDFNNILGAIMGYTELSLAQVPSGSELRENMQDVLAASLRAKTLVQQILAFGRRGEKKVVPVDATRLVGEAMKLLVSVIPRTITIERDLDPAAGSVMADPSELHQVVMNLCTNAYQAMSETGGAMRVKVGAASLNRLEASHVPNLAPGEYVIIEVSDNGPGMDEKTLGRIFEPYFTTKPLGKGTGLGLALVHGIVAALNGAISVKSTPGLGTAFTVYLPRLLPAASAAQKAAESGAAKGKGNVLLVDDEPALARLGRKMLESLGYTVREFTDPAEALRLFESDPHGFDVIVTDMTMPGLTGAEMLKRAMALRPGMPSVMCTGYSDLIDEQGAKEQGIGAYVQKPYDKNKLGMAVGEALGGGK